MGRKGEFGIVIGANGRAVRQEVDSSENALKRFQASVDRLAKQIVSASAPAAEGMHKLQLAVAQAGGAAKLSGADFELVKRKLQELQGAGAKVPAELERVKRALQVDKRNAFLEDARRSVKALSDELSGAKATRELKTLERAIKEAGGIAKISSGQIEQLEARVKSLQAAGGKVPRGIAGLAAAAPAAAVASGPGLGSQLGGALTTQLQGAGEGLASKLGPVGAALAALGPYGIAAAAGIAAVAGAAAAAGAALVGAAQAAIAYGAAFQDLSENTGVASKTLQLIAASSGIGSDGMEAFTSGIRKLNKELINSPERFAQLGLSAQKLIAMQPEERFQAVAAAIAKLGTDAEQSAASQELLGKSFPLKTLKDFADIQAKMNRAEGLGLWVDSTPQLKALSDELGVAGKAWSMLAIQFGSAVASTPALLGAVSGVTAELGQMVNWVKDNKTQIQEFTTGAIVPAVEALGLLAKALGMAAAGFVAMASDAARALGSGALDAARDAGPNARRDLKGNLLSGVVSPSGHGIYLPEFTTPRRVEPQAPKPKWESDEARRKAEDRAREMTAGVDQLTGKTAQAEMDKLSAQFAGAIKQVGDVSKLSRPALEQLSQKVRELGAAGAVATGPLGGLQQAQQIAAAAIARQSGQSQVRPESTLDPRLVVDQLPQFNIPGQAVAGGQSFGADFSQFGTPEEQRAAGLEAKVKALNEETQRWRDTLQDAAAITQLIGSNIASEIVGGIGAAASAVGKLKAQLLASGSSLKSVASGNIGALFKNDKGGFSLSNTLGSISAGFQAVGAVKSVVDGLKKLFGGDPIKKAQKAIGQALGTAISRELAESISKNAKQLGVSLATAGLLSLSAVMAEGQAAGKSAGSFSGQAVQLLQLTKDPKLAAKATSEVGKAFGEISEEALKSGVIGSQALRSVIREAKNLKAEIPEIKQFVGEQLADAAAGVGAGVKGIKIVTPEDARAQAEIAQVTFWAVFREKGLLAAGDAFKDVVTQLKESLGTLGGDAATEAILAPIQAIVDLSGNEMFRGAAEGAQGFANTLRGLANSDIPLTAGQFGAFEQQAASAARQAQEAGATNEQAMLAIAPLLQNLVQAAASYGFELDEGTKSLIEQARAAGVAFKTDSSDRLIASIDALTLALGGVPPALDKIGAAAERLDGKTIDIGVNVGSGEPYMPGQYQDDPTGPRITAARGFGPKKLTEDTLFQAHKGEHVVIVPRNKAVGFKSAARGFYQDTDGGGGPMNPDSGGGGGYGTSGPGGTSSSSSSSSDVAGRSTPATMPVIDELKEAQIKTSHAIADLGAAVRELAKRPNLQLATSTTIAENGFNTTRDREEFMRSMEQRVAKGISNGRGYLIDALKQAGVQFTKA